MVSSKITRPHGGRNQPLARMVVRWFTQWWSAFFFTHHCVSLLTIPMLQMILKSMQVECNKTDMDNYAGDVDEEESGKFTFVQFCSVRNDNQ